MAPLNYLNFDLTFESSADGYAVRATSSVAGEARAAFVFPFNELELENFLLRLGQRSSGTRRADSPEMELSKQFGGRLFDALFDDDVRAALRSSISASERQGAGLRLRLRFGNAPELADIPWEYLYDSGANRFLALSRDTPLVRYLDLSRAVEPLQVQTPLRILVMISDPTDYDRLDVEAEWQRLTGALADLQQRGLVEIVRLDKATLLELQRTLRGNPFHIFHYIGHGVYDEGADDGFLVLEDENGRGRKVGGQYVGTLLADHRSLRLAVLNSCEGGRSSRSDPFAGAAQSLIQQGLPAVVAMQFEISDDAAAVFAQEFYMALAGGYPVDGALAEGRRAIFATKTNAEWGIPVLFLRAADGQIFQVQAPARAPVAPPTAPAPPLPEVAQPQRSAEEEQPEIPVALPSHPGEDQPAPGTISTGAGVGWQKMIRPTGSTSNDLQMVKIIGGVVLGAFVVMALVFYLIFRNSTNQATPAALLPPTIDFFRAEPTQVVSGESVQLSWSITGDVTGVTLAGPGVDRSLVLSRTGTLLVTPEESANFTLTARNFDQSNSDQVAIAVRNPTPVPAGDSPSPPVDGHDVKVTFDSVRILDDCDGALTGLGEFWLDLTVDDQRLRWPESGTNEVDSGQSYAINQSISLQVADDDSFVITGAGFEVDETQIESMGSIRVVHGAADNWWQGSDTQTSLAVCNFELTFEIAALSAQSMRQPSSNSDSADSGSIITTTSEPIDCTVSIPAETVAVNVPSQGKILGIDVSRFITVDWNRLNSHVVAYTFIRATQGDYSVDSSYSQHLAGAQRAGIIAGAYHVFDPDSDVIQQSLAFAQVVKPNQIELPPVVDVEMNRSEVLPIVYCERLALFLELLETTYRQRPIIYTSATVWNKNVAGDFSRYPLWVAHYGTVTPRLPNHWSEWVFSQYTDDGKLEGVDGSIDINVFNGTIDDLRSLAASP